MPKPMIVAAEGTWVVRAGGAVIGESERAMALIEPDAPGVIYFPREDLGMPFLERSDRVTAHARLGEARFYDIVSSNGVIADAAWSYEAPLAGAERITGLIAFDGGRVAIEEV